MRRRLKSRVRRRPLLTVRAIWEETHPLEKPIAALYRALKKLLPAQHAIVGAYAYAVHVEPRETQDVDVLVGRRAALAIAKKLSSDIAGVTWNELPFVIRVHHDGKQVIDLMIAESHPLLISVLKSKKPVRIVPRFGKALVPRAEALIAMKYMAACGEYRNRVKKLQDLHDLFAYVHASKIDQTALDAYLELVYTGAAKDFAKFRDDFESGRPITI